MQYDIGVKVFDDWTLTRQLGHGSYGRVYAAQREELGIRTESAVKVITIPQSKAELQSVMSEGMDEASVTAYFKAFVQEIFREIGSMSELKGHPNIVSYEDHKMIPHEDKMGWDVLIRMELLTPLLDHLQGNLLQQSEVEKLASDICNALV